MTTDASIFRWIIIAVASLVALAVLLAIVRVVLARRAARVGAANELVGDDFDDDESGDRYLNSLRGRDGAAAHGSKPEPNDLGTFALAAGLGDLDQDSGRKPVRMVIVDPLTVLFQQSKPADAYVLPFVRHNGGTALDDQIIAAHKQLTLGEISTVTFWRTCGVDGDADVIDGVFCEMRWLRPGAADFLAEFSNRRIPVAGITNDAATWSNLVRYREHLTAVWPWVISSDEHLVKPDPAIFDLLGRTISVPWEECLYVDTDPGALAVAQALGMRTTFFDPERKGPDAALGHPRVANFDGFFRRQLS